MKGNSLMDSIFVYRNPETPVSKDGYLKGLKVAIQPNISVTGWPTEAGSKALVDFVALEDATIIRRLCQAGATIYGSTRMSEFGLGLQGSKASEAVRQQAVDAELVLDLMGESRLAALRAGVCSLKPSYGLVSRYGIIGLIPSMECCGVLSRNTGSIGDVLKTVAGQDGLDFSLPEEKIQDFNEKKINPRDITIGIIKEALDALPAEQDKVFQTAVNELKKAGFSLQRLSLPDFKLFSLVHKIVGSVEASSAAGRYDSVRYGHRAPGAKNWNEMYLLSRGMAFGPLIKSYLFQGAFFQFENYKAFEDACRIRGRLVKNISELFEKVDYLVFPVVDRILSDISASPDEMYTQFSTTVFANVTGQPVLFLPPLDTGYPGLQLAGPRLSDLRLLTLGEYLLNMRQGGK